MAAVGLHLVRLTGQFCEDICELFIISSLCSSSFTEHQQDVRHHEEQGVKHQSWRFWHQGAYYMAGKSNEYRNKDSTLWWVLQGNSSCPLVPPPLQIPHLPFKPKYIILSCSLVFAGVFLLKTNLSLQISWTSPILSRSSCLVTNILAKFSHWTCFWPH